LGVVVTGREKNVLQKGGARRHVAGELRRDRLQRLGCGGTWPEGRWTFGGENTAPTGTRKSRAGRALLSRGNTGLGTRGSKALPGGD